MEEVRAVIDLGNRVHLYVIDGKVVRHLLNPDYMHLPAGAKESMDCKDYTWASSAASPSKCSWSEDEKEKGDGDEVALILIVKDDCPDGSTIKFSNCNSHLIDV